MLSLLILLALLAGLAKCWTISQRPTTNRKCVGSLMVLLVAWMASIAVNWAFASFPGLEPLGIVLELLPSAFAVCAALLAVAGLKDYSRAKGYYTQGQAQAFSTLVVSGLLLLLIAAVTFGGIRGSFFGRTRAAGGRPLVFEELNFKFLSPGSEWSQLETNSLDPKATLGFRCTRPEIYFLIVAQKAPNEKFSIDDLWDVALRNLSNAVATLRVIYRASTYLAGYEGLRVHSEATRSGQKFYYQHRLLVLNGLTYQLIFWGADRERLTIAEEADYLIGRFTLLDDRRRARVGNDSSLASRDRRAFAVHGANRQSRRAVGRELRRFGEAQTRFAFADPAKSVLERRVERATRPCRSATRRPERARLPRGFDRPDLPSMPGPFRPASRRTAQASGLCYPKRNFQTRSN